MERTHISDEHKALWQCPTIASQLPVTFNTGFRFTTMMGHCAGCSKGLPDECTHGRVTRPTPKVADISGVGYCDECKLLTPFRMRMYEDQRYTLLRNEGWVEFWMRKSRTERVKDRIKGVFRWLFTF